MTDVRNNDFTFVETPQDVIPLYQGNGRDAAKQYIGMETEICVYKKDGKGGYIPASAKDCARLIEILKESGFDNPQLEIASAVEYASPAYRVRDIAALCSDTRDAYDRFLAAIEKSGLIASKAALAPFMTVDAAKDNLVDRDRARGLVKGMGMHKAPEFLKVTLLCTSTQVSLSYKDPADLYDLLATGYALIPAVYGLFANYPATIENKVSPIDFNPRAAFYSAFGKDGGIPDSLLQAKDGDDFVRRHVSHVFGTEMLFYYERTGDIIWPEKPVRFEELKAIGLNTRSNYDLAESFVYTDIKVCNIRDENGIPTGKRIEVRSIDAGETGVVSGAAFIHALLRDEKSNAAVKGLLQNYGVAPGIDGWQEKLQEARTAVGKHQGRYLDIPFGHGTLKEFCRDLGFILQLHVQRKPELKTALQPIIQICKSGVTEAEIHAKQAHMLNTKAANLPNCS